MTDYNKLVEALRCGEYKPECGASDCPYWSGLGCMDGQLVTDAADAIEKLQADLKACRTLSKCRLQGWKESELFCEEQAKTLESVDVLNKSYLERIRKLEQQLPKHWVSVEDELPSEFQSVWAACKMGGRENWTIETTYDPYLSCPWGHIPVLDSGKAIVYAWMDRTEPEPPQEDAGCLTCSPDTRTR